MWRPPLPPPLLAVLPRLQSLPVLPRRLPLTWT
jgi:hypothetical protein